MKRFPLIVAPLIVAMIAATIFLFSGCAQPGQPPNAFNTFVGFGEIALGNIAISEGNARLTAAYQQGKITTNQYNALYAEEVAAQAAVNNLGAATAANQPVTQAQVNAAVATFIAPLNQLIPTQLPPPVTTQPGR